MVEQKLYIGGVEQDDQRCLRCGSWYLDTGWECNDCGYDNRPHYYQPKDAQPQESQSNG